MNANTVNWGWSNYGQAIHIHILWAMPNAMYLNKKQRKWIYVYIYIYIYIYPTNQLDEFVD